MQHGHDGIHIVLPQTRNDFNATITQIADKALYLLTHQCLRNKFTIIHVLNFSTDQKSITLHILPLDPGKK